MHGRALLGHEASQVALHVSGLPLSADLACKSHISSAAYVWVPRCLGLRLWYRGHAVVSESITRCLSSRVASTGAQIGDPTCQRPRHVRRRKHD